MSTIELRKITKRFGAFIAVKDVDLTVAAGEVVCLLGPSGCGKTTTLRMIAGLERATSGDVIIAGKRMNELPPREARHRHGVPVLCALSGADRRREHRHVPLHYERLSEADESTRRVDQGRRASCTSTDVLDRMPGPDLGRREAARRGGPRHRARSQLLPVRRAACRASTSSCAIRCAARSRRCCRAFPRRR